MTIGYDDVVDAFFREFPTVESAYREQLSGVRDTPHVVFCEIVSEHVAKALEAGETNGLLCRIFEFIEKLSWHEDEAVRNLVEVSFCETLLLRTEDPTFFKKAKSFMGPATLRVGREIERHLLAIGSIDQLSWEREN